MNEWSDPQLIDAYVTANADPANNWYEREVNIPSILSLLPKGSNQRVLDFGCGPGGLTSLLSHVGVVQGADASPGMVNKAKENYPEISFFVWDGASPLPTWVQPFNTIITKLALEFIADLDSLAHGLSEALVADGQLIVSVTHPILAATNGNMASYGSKVASRTQIGTTGIYVDKFQHSISAYINAFLQHGFVLEKVLEPTISSELQASHHMDAAAGNLPKRLNLQFKKIVNKV